MENFLPSTCGMLPRRPGWRRSPWWPTRALNSKCYLWTVLVLLVGTVCLSQKVFKLAMQDEYEVFLPEKGSTEMPGKIPKYPLRDVSNFSGVGYMNAIPETADGVPAECMHFSCSKSRTSCDNTQPTSYDGPEPPCCTHILRDMLHAIDEAMSTLGLEYLVSSGTLLGLYRSGRVIPWTADNDLIIKDAKTEHAMVALWGTVNATGLHLMRQGLLRICINQQFAGGKLKKWSDGGGEWCPGWLYSCGMPYTDIYSGRNYSKNLYGEYGFRCRYFYSDVFPTKRLPVYDGAFALNFPANPEPLLRSYYGMDWRTPRVDENPHGQDSCKYGPLHGRNRTCPFWALGFCTPGPIVDLSPEPPNPTPNTATFAERAPFVTLATLSVIWYLVFVKGFSNR